MKSINLFFITCLFVSFSCDEMKLFKSKDENGKVSLSMKVNDEQWIASSANGAHPPVVSIFSSGEVQLEGFLNKDNGDSFTIVVKVESDFGGTGTYWQDVSAYYYSDLKGGEYKVYSTQEDGGNSAITFTKFDESNGFASGTFTCRIYNDGEKMMITQGVFENLRIDYL